jgi:DHA1 family bicyclomycin/chloramphenicol resistance-like MFS transporter
MGFLQMGISALVGIAVGRFHDGTTVPTAVAVCVTTLVLLACFHLVVRPAVRGGVQRSG